MTLASVTSRYGASLPTGASNSAPEAGYAWMQLFFWLEQEKNNLASYLIVKIIAYCK